MVILQSDYGNPKPDGGTQFAGSYYVADPGSPQSLYVFKSKALPPLSNDPPRGASVNATGNINYFPLDGGQIELESPGLDLMQVGPGTLPTPMTVTAAQLNTAGSDNSAVGYYVTVPAGTYTQDDAATEMHTGTFQDGVALTDGAGNRILVETFTFKFSTGNCVPTDGGFADFSAGGFNGVFDYAKAPDGTLRKILYFGNCDGL